MVISTADFHLYFCEFVSPLNGCETNICIINKNSERRTGKQPADVGIDTGENQWCADLKWRDVFRKTEWEWGILEKHRGKGRKKRGVQPSRTCLLPFHQQSLWKLASSSFPPFSHLLSSPLRKRQSEQAREVRTERKRERHSQLHWAVKGILRKQALQFALLFSFLPMLFLTPSSSSPSTSWQNTL